MRDVILVGDVIEKLRSLPDESVHCVVTSPPYWGLRDYGVDGQIGLEPTPDAFVARMVEVFREVRRVLRRDGTCWVNLGDSYAGGGRAGGNPSNYGKHAMFGKTGWDPGVFGKPQPVPHGLKPKDLVGIPWRVAFALQADGWYLRSDIIWAKPNPMPESVTDRPTKAHEYLFLLTKSPRYYYDAEAVRESTEDSNTHSRGPKPHEMPKTVEMGRGIKNNDSFSAATWGPVSARNRRTVWTIATEPFPGAHFATFPRKLVEPCILAGCPEKSCPECGAPWVREVEIDDPNHRLGKGYHDHTNDLGRGQRGVFPASGAPRKITTGFHPSCTCGRDPVPGVVLDPFFGSGTVGVVALKNRRSYIGIELNPEYAELARRRIEYGTVDEEEVAELEKQLTMTFG